MAPELLFALVVRVCGDAAPPCKEVVAGHYLSEADCKREAKRLGWATKGAVRCVVRAVNEE